jgi:hypothetical protein
MWSRPNIFSRFLRNLPRCTEKNCDMFVVVVGLHAYETEMLVARLRGSVEVYQIFFKQCELFKWDGYRDLAFTLLSYFLNCIFVYLSMALQLLVGPWPLFSSLILYTVCRTPWKGDQPVARPLPLRRRTQTQNKHTQISMP